LKAEVCLIDKLYRIISRSYNVIAIAMLLGEIAITLLIRLKADFQMKWKCAPPPTVSMTKVVEKSKTLLLKSIC
jgi:hypothetical protein